MRAHARKLWMVAAVATLAVTVAGCGGGDDKKDDATVEVTSGNNTASSTTAPKTLERTLGKTVWWNGFEITADKLSAEPQIGSGVNITIDMTWKNLGDEAASPPQAAIDNGGENISAFSDAGQASGQASVKGTITASIPGDSPTATVDPAKVADGLKLVWGEASDNQSILPLDESTEPTTFEPKELATYKGKITTPTVVIDVTDGGYHWGYDSGQKGKFILTARIKVSCGTPCPDEGTAMTLSDITLTVPGETTPISPDDQSSGFCCEAVYPGTVSDKPENTVAFILDGEPSGKYTLTYNPDRADPKPGKLTFSV